MLTASAPIIYRYLLKPGSAFFLGGREGSHLAPKVQGKTFRKEERKHKWALSPLQWAAPGPPSLHHLYFLSLPQPP